MFLPTVRHTGATGARYRTSRFRPWVERLAAPAERAHLRGGAMADDLVRIQAALADRYTIHRELGSGGMP